MRVKADKKGYKYLGIREMYDIFQEKMKEKFQKEHYKRVRALLKCKLNGENVINAINIWAVPTVWYRDGITTGIRESWIKLTNKRENC